MPILVQGGELPVLVQGGEFQGGELSFCRLSVLQFSRIERLSSMYIHVPYVSVSLDSVNTAHESTNRYPA